MEKILVIQNKRIGDVLIASVIAQNVKKIFPESQIDFLVYDYTVGVIENNPAIDQIIEVNDKELKKLGNLKQLIQTVRKREYDIIFDPYSKLQSRLVCYFSKAPIRIGFQKRGKNPPLKFYTHNVPFLEEKTKICGKAIEDRINMVTSVFTLPENQIDYEPKIILTEEEKQYNKLDSYNKPFIMLGILGSTPQKSMPYEYIVELIDFITENYQVNVLFNYAPHQKKDALEIYESCKNKDSIVIDIYEDSIRGFIKLMNKCELLVGNEGGVVHISKALNKPTFTIFSPYVMKDHWASFEDGKKHASIHLLEEKPKLYNENSVENRRKIEADPSFMYKQLTPGLIIPKLKAFLDIHLKN
ncbi:glycosyltransferase family 9 protein [Xanthomarina sp. F2636L]|uniref:glycosyltransferase family 9 protein n=1 Tax=Xanthomarina sp. F2636L TaxID=2996018 RepID=UPI00225DD3A9|nr:glycosyltransferase family 9 protein [Xanthomarina sp. F2636L]MCX7549989.1 glycosyltransferase family 9 protein [Xanthomarina sp. F2636L]